MIVSQQGRITLSGILLALFPLILQLIRWRNGPPKPKPPLQELHLNK